MLDAVIRMFEPIDFDEVVAQWHHTNLVAYPYCAEHQRHSLEDARTFFRDVVLTSCWVLVATRKEVRVGVLALEPPWIRQLAVFPQHQRQGVGHALLMRAQSLSPRELRLFTFQRNTPARRFYESHGFVPVAFGMSPAPECEPDVEYRWGG
ncbi:MAG TPA: GNAT family N-acetyltransferase [Casimicrobiaceae bacterium]|nr:GNAT family N-acetyltransferase [Casimicrobiaceae bacterium]